MYDTFDDIPDWWGTPLLARPPSTAPWARSGRTVTYGQLRRQVTELRRLFQSHGIRAGATVALRGVPSFSQLWAVFSLWSLGAQVHLMSSETGGPELAALLDRTRPQFYIAFGSSGLGGRHFHDECEIFVRRLRDGLPAADDHALVQFTSASTGAAKAVGRSVRSLLTELDTFVRIGGMPRHGDRVLIVGPLTHSFPLIGGLLHNMNVGAETVLPRSSSVPSLLRSAIRSDADTLLGSSEQFAQLARCARPLAIRGLRRAIAGGARLNAFVHTAFEERHGVRIGQAYGTTETGIIAADPTGWFGPDTAGMIAPGVHVRLLSGELQVRLDRSPYVGVQSAAPGFLRGEDGAGWLRTGDLVAFDPDNGGLRITGRTDPLLPPRPPTREPDHVLLAPRTAGRALTRAGKPVT
ncbi:class I adenylate-forming enzyme family protein [Streptomyces sp. A0958]|uniref:class I adenylate-forming enzyme family protein n=1 Tax=Streptomyces sp. A0958 TaxID=2563101 RepID=UPI0014488DDC|nr:class I adenylate-forming enzyme family protein [Streptomyces sp. A0958]